MGVLTLRDARGVIVSNSSRSSNRNAEWPITFLVVIIPKDVLSRLLAARFEELERFEPNKAGQPKQLCFWLKILSGVPSARR